MIRRWILIVAALVWTDAALAWGETGHRVVCEIAYAELNDEARQQVDALIALDPMYDNFAESCLFADFPERIRWREHFMNVPRSANAIAMSDCPMAEACVLTAIRSDAAKLVEGLPEAERLLALKLLGHWVGDIHQPMHVSFEDDRGANSVGAAVARDVAAPEPGFGPNLHSVWDSTIIDYSLGDDAVGIAATLRAEITDAERRAWQYDSPVEWADESYQVTIDADTGYCVQRKGLCRYTEKNRMFNDGEPVKVVVIDREYIEAQAPVVRLRLKQAGVRLASVINRQMSP